MTDKPMIINSHKDLDLHALAKLPAFGAAGDHIRACFDPHWGKVKGDQADYIVEISFRGSIYKTVLADSLKEAEEIAMESVDIDDAHDCEFELENVRLKKELS